MDNIFAVINAAFLTEKDELLKNAANFVKKNGGKFKETQEWTDFEKSHPKCFIKLLKFIMFDNEKKEDHSNAQGLEL